MPADLTEAVRSNARYLRNVRPVDPEEICEYVEGRPHPAVVRRTLREEAFDLGLREREDGAFVPVEPGPVVPDFDGVDRLPGRYERALTDALAERYGPSWYEGDSGRRVRETVGQLKSDYYRQHPVEYDADVALAYAVYHLADYYATTQYVLHELGRDGLLPRRLRVLDVGAGVGAPALGLHDYLDGEEAVVEYHAVEPSDAADVLETLLGETGRDFHATVHRERAEAFSPDGAFDLVVFSNVLSELDDPTAVVESYLDALAEDGTLAAVAPADRNTATNLREVERRVVRDGAATVYAPAVWLWPGDHPTDEGWSFDARPDLAVPAFQERLAAGAENPPAFRNTSVKFSYSLLRVDGRRRVERALDRSEAAKLGAADAVVTDRVDLTVAKLSRDLSDGEGANPVFKISDGSESVSCYAVLVNETELNATLRRAGYGALLRVENALVLWNDDEGSYNAVVDEETVVDPA
ncbi:MAG: small ribosomal subunit Rsm22 family protein [Halobacteriaceae archaeon]